MIIHAKVDVREGTAWTSLDKALRNLEGPASNSQHSMSAASETDQVSVAGNSDDEHAGVP